MASGNEQFGSQDRFDKLRNELEAKIGKESARIDGKLSTSHFCWAVGISVTIILSVLGVAVTLFINLSGKVEPIQTRLTVIETHLGIKR